MDEMLIRQAGARLAAAQRILIVCHIRPDGDAIGALLGLGLALQAAGKTVQMVCADGVPANLRHLEGSQQVLDRPKGDFNAICVVDCSDLKRTGSVLESYPQPDINIDHHITNLEYARINLVDPEAVSTTQMLANLLPQFNLSINQTVASALLTGLVTDTIGFRTSNINANTLRLAADLMEAGANLPVLYYRSLVGRSYEGARLWGAGLSRLQKEGSIVWCALTKADRKAVDYPGKDDADLVNVLSAIEETEVAIVIVEQNASKIKVSWRAQPGIDVAQIAMRFGGGGHPAAAGAEIELPLQDAVPLILEATHTALAQPILSAAQQKMVVQK